MPITEAPGSLQNGNHLAIPKPTLMGPAIDVAPAETDGQLLVAGLQIPDAALARPQSNGYYVANKPMPIRLPITSLFVTFGFSSYPLTTDWQTPHLQFKESGSLRVSGHKTCLVPGWQENATKICDVFPLHFPQSLKSSSRKRNPSRQAAAAKLRRLQRLRLRQGLLPFPATTSKRYWRPHRPHRHSNGDTIARVVTASMSSVQGWDGQPTSSQCHRKIVV